MGSLLLGIDSAAEWGVTACCLQLSCSLVGGKKTKGLQSYGCHLLFVSRCFKWFSKCVRILVSFKKLLYNA